MPLSFLRLPKLVQAEVLQHVSLLDFFSFSSLSFKSRAICSIAKKKVDSLKWDFSCTGLGVKLENCQNRDDCHLEVPTRDHMELQISISLNQEAVPVHKSGKNNWFIGSHDLVEAERKKLFEQLNDLIFDIFKIRDYHLAGNIFDCKDLVSKYTNNLKNLKCNDDDLQAELSQVLEEFNVEELKIEFSSAYRANPIEFSSPLNVTFLKCENLYWISQEALLTLECEKLTIESFFLRDDELIKVVRGWMGGGLRNLKEFTIKVCFVREEELLEAMGTIEAERIDRGSFRIQREDGTSASISASMPGFVMTIDN